MNKQFEEWLKSHAIYKDFMYKVPFSMQWGVYLEFFDSIGYLVEVFQSNKTNHFLVYINKVHYPLLRNLKRQEAQQEAIKKAFTLLD